MAQTNFNANNFATLGTVLAEIDSGGADAAVNTAYTIDLTGGVSGPSATENLLAGSSLELSGQQVINVPDFAVTGTLVTDLNFTGTVVLDNGVLDNVALAVSNGITVAGLFTGSVLGTQGDGGDSVINSGIIQSSGAANAIELDTGTIQNGWNGPVTAQIIGGATGVQLDTGGLVENGGTILGGSTSAAVFLASGTLLNGTISDQVAELSGGAIGVQITGTGTVTNDGTIIGDNGVYIGAGTVTNGQIGDTGALIQAGTIGVWIDGAGSVNNFATILSQGEASVYLAAGGSVTNGSAVDPQALIAGYNYGILAAGSASVTNYATIEADSTTGIGIWLENGGTVINQTTASYLNGYNWGVLVEDAAGFVTNFGTILSETGFGVDLNAGGTVVNESQALIDGSVDGVRISAGAPDSGALVTNEGTIIGNVGVDFQSGTIAAAGTVIADGLIEGTGGYAITFGTGNERLILESGGTLVGNVLGNDSPGNTTTLELAAGTSGTISAIVGDTGTVTDSAGSFAYSGISSIVVDPGAEWTLCFCKGTLIRTPSGDVPVETLKPGDTVRTWDGGRRPVTWIGTGSVLATRGRRGAATPVIVRKSALAPNVPAQDLHVTKGHALLQDGVLIPVEYLVNHRTILWDDRAQEVRLYHVELDAHDVMIANGAPAESYRDDGNRWLFQNANTGWDQPPKAPCAPLLTGGPIVDAAWKRLLDRAGPRPGRPLTDDPDLHALVDGRRIDPIMQQNNTAILKLGVPSGPVQIASRSVVPTELGIARDSRTLGIGLASIVLRAATRFRVIEARDPRLTDGFHPFEPAESMRWTDGCATLSSELWYDLTGPLELVLRLSGKTQYAMDGAARRVA